MTIATTEHGSELALTPDQTHFTSAQISALQHMGVENATEGDLTVFHHVCTRTGLDPFARQIYMIGRNSKTWDPRTKQESWVTKFTIQTGIDGFRLIGRRAADRARHTISVGAPEWAHEDGAWRPIWLSKWGNPVAARVTIQRAGEPFVAVALFDEYKQTKRDGGLTQMWQQRPAGQIAKCAEALAWRMAFPQDLSGIYADEEMGQADRHERPESQATTSRERLQEALRPTVTAEQMVEAEPMVTPAQIKKIATAMGELSLNQRETALAYVADVIGREVESRNDLTRDEAGRVIDALEADLASPADEPAEADQ